MTRKPEAVDLNRFVGRTTDDDPWRSEPRSPAGTPSARPTDGRCEEHDDRVAEHRDQVKPEPIRVVGSEDPAQISACRRTSSAMEEIRVPVARVSLIAQDKSTEHPLERIDDPKTEIHNVNLVPIEDPLSVQSYLAFLLVMPEGVSENCSRGASTEEKEPQRGDRSKQCTPRQR